jgi:hypothetical protein
MTSVGSPSANDRARTGSTASGTGTGSTASGTGPGSTASGHHAWSEAITQTLQAVAARQARPSNRDTARSLRFLADQIERGDASPKLMAEAGADCLVTLERKLEADDRLRRTPRFTHAAMSAQAMEKSDG